MTHIIFDWPARPTLTLTEDDPGHRCIAQDYEASERRADRRDDKGFLLLFWALSVGYVVFMALAIWKLVELVGAWL